MTAEQPWDERDAAREEEGEGGAAAAPAPDVPRWSEEGDGICACPCDCTFGPAVQGVCDWCRDGERNAAKPENDSETAHIRAEDARWAESLRVARQVNITTSPAVSP